MSDEKTDIEIVQEFLKCSPERAQEMIDCGINVEFIRNKADNIFQKPIEEAKTRFLEKIIKITEEINED